MNPPAIVDSHVHFWNPAQLRYAWLHELPVLNRSFLPADFATVSLTSAVRKIIFVESGCDPTQSLAECDWVAGLAKSESRIKGIVAHAALERGALVRPKLEALAKCPLVKGVRRNLQGESDADFCLSPEFLAGIGLLAEAGFTFDICIRHDQLRALSELVRRVPEVSFVLDHFGKPDVRGGKTEPWAADLKTLAAAPNVVCKFSGLTTETDWQHWQAADLMFYIEWAVECFGFDRALFGGDWPVATLATGYARWIHTVNAMVESASEADRLKLFQTNAERIYHV